MRFEVRLHIDGARFYPQAFADGLPSEDAGEIRHFLGHRFVNEGLGCGFWVSKTRKVSQAPEAACLDLLASTSSHLKAARASCGEVTIQVSAYYKAGDDHRGFYVPSRLAHLVGAVEASLDYSPEIDRQASTRD
jgi:hypothetical protein